MTQAVLSTKYQLVVPLEIRKQLGLHSGQKMLFLVKEGVITLVPDRPLKELKGIGRGLRAGILREKKDRSL
jgi:AbrB family looped-hinge helix DNA binding protein